MYIIIITKAKMVLMSSESGKKQMELSDLWLALYLLNYLKKSLGKFKIIIIIK